MTTSELLARQVERVIDSTARLASAQTLAATDNELADVAADAATVAMHAARLAQIATDALIDRRETA